MGFLPTFAEFQLTHGLPEAEGRTLTQRIDILWAQYDQAIWRWIREIQDDPHCPGNYSDLLAVLSEEIIASHLGPEWFTKHVINSAKSPQAEGYLRFDGDNGGKLLSVHRVHELARRLYQLQSFTWFDDVVDKLRTRTLSGASFELDVLWVLHVVAALVTARTEVGRKGEDYDISVRTRNLVIPIEVKAKDDDTAFEGKTLGHTLRSAARQLPKGTNGIVFVRVPSAWVGPRLEEEYGDALAEATRSTTRVAAVISAIDKPHLNDAGTQGHVTRHYHFFSHDECPEEIWNYCLDLKRLLEEERTQMAPPPPF